MTEPTAAGATTRLNKRMAELGMCSRREADDWIARGWVRVNGQVAPMGLQVAPDARIDVDPKARGQQQQQVTILLNKPMGYVSGQAEDNHQPAVVLVQERNHWRGDASKLRFAPQQLRGLAPGGTAGHRLDRPAGADPGRAHRTPADRRGQRHGKGIPRARDLCRAPGRRRRRRAARLPARATRAAAPWPERWTASRSSPRRSIGRTRSSCASSSRRARSARSGACASRWG